MTGEPVIDRVWFPFDRQVPAASCLLIALPVAGAGAASLLEWRRDLPDDVALCTPQLPGREHRLSDPPCSTMGALVDALVPALQRRIDRPYALLGHSMGGIIALEAARHLDALGLPARWLFVSACRPPDRWPGSSPVRDLSDSQVAEYLGRLGGSPPEVLANRELMELLLPTIRADYEICASYDGRGTGPVQCPITVFGGSHDPLAPADELPQWRAWTTGAFAHEVYAGDHFFHTVHRRAITASIVAALRRA